MESLVAWVKVSHRKKLRVVAADADRYPALLDELGVVEIPALVLVKENRVVDRLEGRVTGRQIDDLVRRHVA